MVSLEEHLNEANGLIGEAKAILEDPAVREKMRINSYLGEMEEITMYKQALVKAEAAVRILTEHNGRMLPDAEELVVKINNKINPPEPEPVKVKPEPVKSKEDGVEEKTVKKTGKSRKGVKK